MRVRWAGVAFLLCGPACSSPAPETGETQGSANSGTGESGDAGETSTSGETGETGTSTSTSTGEETGGFPPPTDVPPDGVACDIWEPECAEGQKCTAYATQGSSWDANKCVPIMGDAAPGDDCTATDGSGVSGNDTCTDGTICWDIEQDTQVGYCVAFCTGSANDPKCEPGTLCAIYNNGVLPLCLFECDPIDPQCPNPDNLCIGDPGGNGFVCVLDASGGVGGYGEDCTFGGNCNQGLFCTQAKNVPGCMTDVCCSEFCDVTEPNTCSGKDQGQVCVPWYEEGKEPPGYENVGGCALPP